MVLRLSRLKVDRERGGTGEREEQVEVEKEDMAVCAKGRDDMIRKREPKQEQGQAKNRAQEA